MILDDKITELLLQEGYDINPLITDINKDMDIYGDASFIEYILKKAAYYALKYSHRLDESTEEALYKLLKLNMK